jgi:hypothetical protein
MKDAYLLMTMEDVPENLDYRVINAIKSQKHTSKTLKESKLTNIFKLSNPFFKFAYTFLLVFILFTVGTLLFFFIAPQLGNNCVVTSIKGNAYYIDKYGKQIKLAKNYKLYGSSIIKTDPDSYIQLKLNGRQDLFIYEGTQLKINELSKIKDAEKTNLSINFGYCRFKLKKLNKNSSFIVETDSIILSVVGTEFTAGVYNKDISNVSVFEGVVKIKLKTGLANKIASIRNIDTETADEIESLLNQNVDLSKGQTMQISGSELTEKTAMISNLIEKIEIDYSNNNGSEDFKKIKINSKKTLSDIDKIIKNIYFKEGKKNTNKPENQTNIKLEVKSDNLNENNLRVEKTDEPKLIGEWLFNGNTFNTAGVAYNAEVHGAVLTKDRFGNDKSAYYFDGKSNIKINA